MSQLIACRYVNVSNKFDLYVTVELLDDYRPDVYGGLFRGTKNGEVIESVCSFYEIEEYVPHTRTKKQERRAYQDARRTESNGGCSCDILYKGRVNEYTNHDTRLDRFVRVGESGYDLYECRICGGVYLDAPIMA